MRILFDSKNEIFKKPFGPTYEGMPIKISIHIPKKCKTKVVTLFINDDNMQNYMSVRLDKTGENDDYDFFTCDFAILKTGLYFYYFGIKTFEGYFELFKENYKDTRMNNGDYWQISCLKQDFKVAKKFCGKVMYQIFPDRFFKDQNPDLTEKLKPFTVHQNIYEIPDFKPNDEGEVLNSDFFGGNLKGIIKKLDYLKELGISVIYLNPIFKAYSNHRYDTADYKKIDEMLGNENDFINLCKKAHEKDISIILDMVLSHTGSNSVYFDKNNVFKNGAYHSKNSPYYSWYDFKNWPDDYISWWGIKTLPCVNELDEKYLDFIIRDKDSVIAHYLKLGADGYRLDVADELPDEFIYLLKKRMKEIKKDSLLIGEVWEDASNKISYSKRRKYFTNSELDSVMNYPFRNAIIDFVIKKDNGKNFKNIVMSIAENYPFDVLNTVMNILSTHDTPRILTLLSGAAFPNSKEERSQFKLSEDEFNIAKSRLFVATFIQFILPGMPSIFYGDEIGTQGLEDPFCRSFFDWQRINNNEILDFYKEIINIKNTHSALKNGGIRVEFLEDGFIKIIRKNDNEKLIAYINASNQIKDLNENGKIIFYKNYNNFKLNPNGFILIKV